MKAHLPIFILAAALAGAACARDAGILPDSLDATESAPEGIPVNFSVEGWTCEDSKSSIEPDIPDAINDICVVVLRSEDGIWVPVAEECRYFSDPHRAAVTPGEDAPRKLLFIANCGGNPLQRILSHKNLDDLAGSFRLEYADCVGAFSGTGMPMTAWVDIEPGWDGSMEVRLRRLYSRFLVSVSQDQLRWSDFTVTGLTVHNAPKAVYPFALSSRIKTAEETAEDADLACGEDLETLQGGGVICLYILENVQGELLPGNGQQNAKVPARLYEEGLGEYVDNGLLTSLTLSASARTPWGDYSNIDFRAYLGKDSLGDFSIEGNSSHRLDIHLTSDRIRQDGWRIEPSAPTGVARPSMDIRMSSYQNARRACAPRVDITIPDYDRLSRYLGDFAAGICVEVRGVGQHGAGVKYRVRNEWESVNSTLLDAGGRLIYSGTLNSGFTDSKGYKLYPYYSNECEVDITGYSSTLNHYSSRSGNTFTFLLGSEEAFDAPHGFATVIDAGMSSVYNVYSEEYSFDYRPYAGWYWDWERKDYDGNHSIRLSVYVNIPQEAAAQMQEIYGVCTTDICKAASSLPDTYFAGRERLYDMGYQGVQFYVDGSQLK